MQEQPKHESDDTYEYTINCPQEHNEIKRIVKIQSGKIIKILECKRKELLTFLEQSLYKEDKTDSNYCIVKNTEFDYPESCFYIKKCTDSIRRSLRVECIMKNGCGTITECHNEDKSVHDVRLANYDDSLFTSELKCQECSNCNSSTHNFLQCPETRRYVLDGNAFFYEKREGEYSLMGYIAYKMGKKNGRSGKYEFHENIKVKMFEHIYENGFLNGPVYIIKKNQQNEFTFYTCETGNYTDGMRNGIFQTWYVILNKNITTRTILEDGKESSIIGTFNQNFIKHKLKFVNNMKHGTSISFNVYLSPPLKHANCTISKFINGTKIGKESIYTGIPSIHADAIFHSELVLTKVIYNGNKKKGTMKEIVMRNNSVVVSNHNVSKFHKYYDNQNDFFNQTLRVDEQYNVIISRKIDCDTSELLYVKKYDNNEDVEKIDMILSRKNNMIWNYIRKIDLNMLDIVIREKILTALFSRHDIKLPENYTIDDSFYFYCHHNIETGHNHFLIIVLIHNRDDWNMLLSGRYDFNKNFIICKSVETEQAIQCCKIVKSVIKHDNERLLLLEEYEYVEKMIATLTNESVMEPTQQWLDVFNQVPIQEITDETHTQTRKSGFENVFIWTRGILKTLSFQTNKLIKKLSNAYIQTDTNTFNVPECSKKFYDLVVTPLVLSR